MSGPLAPPPSRLVDSVHAAECGLQKLLAARAWFKLAGSSRTVARVDAAISSARGAVRAAGYRDRRGSRGSRP